MLTARIAALAVVALVGCGSTASLAPAPTLYASSARYGDGNIPPALQSTTVGLLYFTDRIPETPGSRQPYGLGRSPSIAFGRVQVSFRGVPTWAELKRLSASSDRDGKIRLDLRTTKELVRFSPSPQPFVRDGGKLVPSDAEKQAHAAQRAAVQSTLRAEMRRAGRREVVLFVPGVNNDFTEGAQTLVNLWHFTERHGVPVLYSWPGGNPGLRGYFRDSVAAEYSIYHFKQVIETIATIPELDRIHIVAHSHGASLATTGLREMIIAERNGGRRPRETLKISNLILAAPDLDFGIVQQRLMAERFGPAFEQVTVYMNPGDTALALAQNLVAGRRFGRLTAQDLTGNDRQVLARAGNVAFVDVASAGGGLAHSYFRNNPAVMSDIALTIRRNAPPGSPVRPLKKSEGNFWLLDAAYPFSGSRGRAE